MTDKLVEQRITEFTDFLASDAPAPGGGAVAALSGALGTALNAMVGALTIGKEKYADEQELVEKTRTDVLALQEKFLAAMDLDVEAFNAISRAYGLPKETEEEKAARSVQIQEALIGCTESPLSVMEMSLEALHLTKALVGHSNQSAASDLGVSALMLEAALKSAWLNVKINLGSMKDKEKATDYEKRAREVMTESLPLAEEIYREVEEAL